MRFRLPTSAAVLLATSLLAAPAPSAAAKDVDPVVVHFVAPAEGPDAAVAEEAFFGARVGLEKGRPGDAPLPFPVTFERLPLPEPGRATEAAFKEWKKGAALVVAWLPDGRVAQLEQTAAKAKVPLLVLSPEATRPSLDPRHAVFWAGGASEQDTALQAMDYALQPLGMLRPVVVADTDRGLRTVEATRFFRHPSQIPEVAGAVDWEALPGQIAQGDGVVFFGSPAGAERLLGIVKEAGLEKPVLLTTGAVSAAVPTFDAGEGATAWAMEPSWFEDRIRLGKEDRYALEDAAKAAERRVVPAMMRGQRALIWVRTALAAAGSGGAKQLVPALRALDRPGAAGKPVFEPYGHASLTRFSLWKSAASEREKLPACHERPETRVPIQGVPAVGFFSASRFRWQPDTAHVWVHWAEGESRTIDEDLFKIGLHTKGYEADLEERVLDDLLGRAISKLNRLFLRNPDGTAIPGVSYAISFSTEPPGDEVKRGPKWEVIIGGDDPAAGGRAFGNTALVFSTFLQRTMYVEHKLEPPLSVADRPHMVGGYVWDTSAEDNVRNGMVRSLVGGFSQAMALTGAHELGHLAGCGHDTDLPRSIMNVQEGAGLEFEWAEWAPQHVELLEKRLKRVPEQH